MHKNAIKLFVGLKIMCGLQKMWQFSGENFLQIFCALFWIN